MVTNDLYLCINSKNNSRRKSLSNSYRNGDHNQLWKYLKQKNQEIFVIFSRYGTDIFKEYLVRDDCET